MNPKYNMKAIELARGYMFVKPELTEDIINRTTTNKNSSILVIFSYEMLPVLRQLGYSNVTLLFDKPRTSIYNIAKHYRYKVVTFEELDKMKFDVVIGNPPFISVDKSRSGATGTHGTLNLYKKFTTKAFDLAKPGGCVTFITLKGVLSLLKKMNKQVDVVNLMMDIDYWKYNTLYFVARNQERTTPYKVIDKVYNKIFTEDGWDVKVQRYYIKQLEDSGMINTGGTRAIVKLPGNEKIVRAMIPTNKAVFGPKLVFPKLYGSAMNPKSNIATEEPIYEYSSCWIPVRTVGDAQKLKKFIFNNPVFLKFCKASKQNRAPGLLLRNLKTFDISQIKTGYEIPKEWNLTKEDLRSLGVE